MKYLQRLQLSLLDAIPQAKRKPIFIYDFSWSGLNEKVKLVAPKEAIRFGQALHSLLE